MSVIYFHMKILKWKSTKRRKTLDKIQFYLENSICLHKIAVDMHQKFEADPLWPNITDVVSGNDSIYGQASEHTDEQTDGNSSGIKIILK